MNVNQPSFVSFQDSILRRSYDTSSSFVKVMHSQSHTVDILFAHDK